VRTKTIFDFPGEEKRSNKWRSLKRLNIKKRLACLEILRREAKKSAGGELVLKIQGKKGEWIDTLSPEGS